jgi:ADP-ribose pyrophosphatase YjhB (NUDIX family)
MLASFWRFLHLSKLFQLKLMRVMNDEFLVGVTGVIFNAKDQVLLFKHTYRQIQWSLPGGYLKAKEHPSEGLEREVEEESGLSISADGLLKVRTDRETGRLDMCYLGEFIGGEFVESKEVSEYKFFSFDELPHIFPDQVLLIHEALKRRKQN